MSNRIVVDPVTRIEGHLRVEVEVKDGRIVDAYSSGTMVRGLEVILKDRDPRDAWAFTERVCGVCTTVHALASVRTVENALDFKVPPNAELIRNLMFCQKTRNSVFLSFRRKPESSGVRTFWTLAFGGVTEILTSYGFLCLKSIEVPCEQNATPEKRPRAREGPPAGVIAPVQGI